MSKKVPPATTRSPNGDQAWPAQKKSPPREPGPGDAPSELIGSRKLLKRTLPGATTAAGSTIDHAWNDQYSPLYGVASPSSGCSPQTITLPRCSPFGISAMWMALNGVGQVTRQCSGLPGLLLN